MRFTKMHGCGNDYVYVNCLKEKVENPSKTAKKVSDRHFGIGSDGLILIKPSRIADFEMAMYNADGSEGSMCGNGIRCVAKYVYDFGLTDKKSIRVATKSGIKDLELTVEGGKVSMVRVNMGEPVFEAEKIPALSETDKMIDVPVSVEGQEYRMTCISMGNPHAVVPINDLKQLKIEETGSKFEKLECFPDRVNTEFVKVLDVHTVQMRVWERGSGETYACGTGACAAAVAAVTNHWVEDGPVRVKLLGGDLEIFWNREENTVYMTGPATVVYSGEIVL